MTKIVRFFLLSGITIGFWFLSSIAYSQNIGINTTGAAPYTSAMLDVLSSDKGILIPRVALTGTGDVSTISSPAVSLLVYNTDTAGTSPTDVLPGFYYWNGTKWIAFSGTGGNDWSLSSNAGTIDGTHFLGTTDNIALNFRSANNKAGRVDQLGPTFFGYQAGNSNTAASNTGFGYQALYANTTGSNNVANGYQALYANTTGSNNVANGHQALYANTTGSNNVANGHRALYGNTTGSNNVANGYIALYGNTTGSNNVANGYGALSSSSTGSNNVANGFETLLNNLTGSNNVAIGRWAMRSANFSNNVVSIGDSSCYSTNTSASDNVIIGFGSYTTGLGNRCVAIGAGASKRARNNNTVVGCRAARTYGNSNVIEDNTIMGYQAGYSMQNVTVTGTVVTSTSPALRNIYVGYQAADSSKGLNNIVIGYDIDAPLVLGNNQMTIGNLIFGTNVSSTGTVVSTGSAGVGTNAPAYILDVAGDINSTTNVRAAGIARTSDARLKKNIMNLNAGTKTIMKLRPVTYQKKESLEATAYTKNEIGFIAQEVQKVLPQLVYEGKDKDKTLALDYNSIIPILTKAIQEQQTELGQLQKENDTMQKQIEEVLNALHIPK